MVPCIGADSTPSVPPEELGSRLHPEQSVPVHICGGIKAISVVVDGHPNGGVILLDFDGEASSVTVLDRAPKDFLDDAVHRHFELAGVPVTPAPALRRQIDCQLDVHSPVARARRDP